MKVKVSCGMLLGILQLLSISTASACDEINQFLLGAVAATEQLVPVRTHTDYGGINTWFEGMEMRYSGSDSDKHDIGFRARPKFNGERAAEHQLASLGEARQSLDSTELLSNELERRYLLLIEVIAERAEVELISDRLVIAKDMNELQRSLVQTEAFDAEDLQDAEFEQMQNAQLLMLHSNRLNILLEQIGYSTDRAESAWSEGCAGTIPPLGNIVAHAESRTQQSDIALANLDVSRLTMDLQIAEQKLAYDRSKNGSFIKFLEVKHSIDSGRSEETTFGLSIPFGVDRTGLLERERDVNGANMSLLETQSRVALLQSQNMAELRWLLTESTHLKQVANNLAQQLERLKPVGQPGLLLRLQRKSHDQARAIKLNHIRAMRSYITWLSTGGLLVQQPLVNWLSASRPALK